MWWSLLLLADAEAPGAPAVREDPLRSPEAIWGVAGLTIALLVGAVVIYAVDQWRKRAERGPTEADATAALTGYRELHESGEITDEEYAKLRDKVAAKVKVPAAPKPDPTRPPAPPGGLTEPPPPGGTA